MREIFKDIPNYEGLYRVSNMGQVKSLNRKANNGHNIRTVKEKILKQQLNKNGYKYVFLYKNGVSKTYKTHQLVAIVFLNHKPNGMSLVVDHINNVKTDNRLVNLKIITSRVNCSKDVKNKTSSFTGVFWSKSNKKWRARVQVNGIKKHLGYFIEEIDASLAYQNFLNKIL